MGDDVSVPDKTSRQDLAAAARAAIKTCVRRPEVLAGTVNDIGE